MIFHYLDKYYNMMFGAGGRMNFLGIGGEGGCGQPTRNMVGGVRQMKCCTPILNKPFLNASIGY